MGILPLCMFVCHVCVLCLWKQAKTLCQNMVQEWNSVRRILGVCEGTPRKQESWDLSVFKRNCFGRVFMLLPCVADRSVFTSGYLLLLAAVIQSNV